MNDLELLLPVQGDKVRHLIIPSPGLTRLLSAAFVAWKSRITGYCYSNYCLLSKQPSTQAIRFTTFAAQIYLRHHHDRHRTHFLSHPHHGNASWSTRYRNLPAGRNGRPETHPTCPKPGTISWRWDASISQSAGHLSILRGLQGSHSTSPVS